MAQGSKRTLEEMSAPSGQARNWTKEEIFEMWPQAARELRGFRNALYARQMGLTANQLDMALLLAEAEFTRMRS